MLHMILMCVIMYVCTSVKAKVLLFVMLRQCKKLECSTVLNNGKTWLAVYRYMVNFTVVHLTDRKNS